jgi:hypothetical protein
MCCRSLAGSPDCGSESHRGHRCMYLVGLVCYQVEVSATGRSRVRWNSTECGVSECDREVWIMKRPWPTGTVKHAKNSAPHTPAFSVGFFFLWPCTWSRRHWPSRKTRHIRTSEEFLRRYKEPVEWWVLRMMPHIVSEER